MEYGGWIAKFTRNRLVYIFRVSSTPKMEAACSAETSVSVFETTWRYIPEDRCLKSDHREKSSLVEINLFNNSEEIFVQELISESVQTFLQSEQICYMECNMKKNMYLL
jgi:hypothetical protein